MTDLTQELEDRASNLNSLPPTLGRHVDVDLFRRAVEEIRRLRFSETMQAKLIGTWIDAHDAVVRRLSRWRALARKRREQVRKTRDDWQADLEAAAAEIEKLKQVIASVGGEEHRAKKALREVSTALDSRTAELEEAHATISRFANDAGWDRLVAERNAAIRERDEARQKHEAYVRYFEDAQNRLRNLKDLVPRLNQVEAERDRARELLKSTEAMVNEHLQARLRAEIQRDDFYGQLFAEINATDENLGRIDLLGSVVCAANLELGWAQLRAEALEAELDGYRGAY